MILTWLNTDQRIQAASCHVLYLSIDPHAFRPRAFSIDYVYRICLIRKKIKVDVNATRISLLKISTRCSTSYSHQ